MSKLSHSDDYHMGLLHEKKHMEEHYPGGKGYCRNCEMTKNVSYRPSQDCVTKKPFIDICCDSCHYIIATLPQ